MEESGRVDDEGKPILLVEAFFAGFLRGVRSENRVFKLKYVSVSVDGDGFSFGPRSRTYATSCGTHPESDHDDNWYRYKEAQHGAAQHGTAQQEQW